jgi:hypothetical protein
MLADPTRAAELADLRVGRLAVEPILRRTKSALGVHRPRAYASR